MPRRNRQKLHRELRLRAEAAKQQQRQLRQRRLAEAEQRRRAAEAVLRGMIVRQGAAVRPPPPIERLFAPIADLLRLAGVRDELTRRVRRVCAAVLSQIPRAARVDELPWFLLLARQAWVRSPESFVAPSGTERRCRDALALHLLARYPVPPFLVRALHVETASVARVPVEDEWAVALLAHVGNGRSLQAIVGGEVLPAPLTRRMQHLLLTATADTEPIEALRRAQVLAFCQTGGRDARVHGMALVRALLRTRLGALRGPDPDVGEPFWHEVIGWICAHGDLAFASLPADEADAVLGWIESRRREALTGGRPFALKGRTGASIRREAAAWRAQQGLLAANAFPASGLVPVDGEWTMVELCTPAALAEEGCAMHHCAAHYAGLAARRKVSLWSLRRAGERVATVEVALPAAKVVQAKGSCNRPCSAEELAAIADWARLNRLRLALR